MKHLPIVFIKNKEISATPATVGGRTIGASTNGLTKFVKRLSLFAKIHANGTPKNTANKAAQSDVHKDNLMAVKSSNSVNNELHGTLVNSEINGAIIIKVASALITLNSPLNFMVDQSLYFVSTSWSFVTSNI